MGGFLDAYVVERVLEMFHCISEAIIGRDRRIDQNVCCAQLKKKFEAYEL